MADEHSDSPDSKQDSKQPSEKSDNVVDLFTRKKVSDVDGQRIVRLSPELDGLEMLYSNDANKDKIFSMKILCWALRQNGEIDAMIPWLSRLVAARNLNDPLNGHWEGYHDSEQERLFYEPPPHKIVELEGAVSYFAGDDYEQVMEEGSEPRPVQEIPDNIGTHAVLSGNGFQSVTLTQITSWRLLENGSIQAMIADSDKVANTPVLAGDSCLYPVQDNKDFKYFFHHVIANKLKAGDPEAMAAFSKLLEQ